MKLLEILAIVLPLAIFAAVMIWWQYARADEILKRWAAEAGIELVSSQMRYFFTGPFFLTHSKGQFVYRIVARDQDGTQRGGWVRVGGWWGGVMFSEKTKVLWDA